MEKAVDESQRLFLVGAGGFARLRAGRVAALGRPRRPIHSRSLRIHPIFRKR